MMNLDTWKKFNESIAGNMTLGLSKPNTVGGLVGQHQNLDDEDDNDDDDEVDNDEVDNDEDNDDEVDDLSNGNDFGEPEEDDGFLASIGSGAGGKDIEGSDDDSMGASDDDSMGSNDFLSSLKQGGEGEQQKDPSDNMDFLNDIDPEIAGFEPENGSDDSSHGDPCPDCNQDGLDHGDPNCPSCNGKGFLSDLDANIDDGDEDNVDANIDDGDEDNVDANIDDGDEDNVKHSDHMNSYMNKMLSYMKKYMKKENANISEFAPAMMPNSATNSSVPNSMGGYTSNMANKNANNPLMQKMANQAGQVAGQAVNAMMKNQQNQPQMMKKRMVKFMSKGGERSFMASDKKRSYMKKENEKKTCSCENTEFLNSLFNSVKGNKSRNSSGITEDSLLKAVDQNYEQEPKAGEYGFSPQGRIGSIGGGYTNDDFKDIPVLGESYKYPTLAQYAAYKHKKNSKK